MDGWRDGLGESALAMIRSTIFLSMFCLTASSCSPPPPSEGYFPEAVQLGGSAWALTQSSDRRVILITTIAGNVTNDHPRGKKGRLLIYYPESGKIDDVMQFEDKILLPIDLIGSGLYFRDNRQPGFFRRDLVSGASVTYLQDGKKPLYSVDLSPDGVYAITGLIRATNLASGSTKEYPLPNDPQPFGVRITFVQNNRLVTGKGSWVQLEDGKMGKIPDHDPYADGHWTKEFDQRNILKGSWIWLGEEGTQYAIRDASGVAIRSIETDIVAWRTDLSRELVILDMHLMEEAQELAILEGDGTLAIYHPKTVTPRRIDLAAGNKIVGDMMAAQGMSTHFTGFIGPSRNNVTFSRKDGLLTLPVPP